MTPEEELKAIDEELSRRSVLGGDIKEQPSELDLINAELAKRGINNDPTQFSGERTWSRAAARSGKSLTAGAVGGAADLAASVYNIPAALTNAQKNTFQDVDPRILGMGEAMGGMSAPIPGQSDLPLIPSAVEAVDKGIDRATEGYTATPEDQKYIQEGLKITGSMAGGVAWAKLVKAVGAEGAAQLLNALSSTKGRDLFGGFVAGATTEKMKEKGYNKPASFAGGAGMGLAATLAAIFAKGASSKMLPLFGHSPKDYNLELHKAAQDIGMAETAPIGLVNESKRYAGAEQITQRTPFVGSKHNRELMEADSEYVNNLKEATKPVGEELSSSTDIATKATEVGDVIKDTFKQAKSAVESEKDRLYKASDALIPQDREILLENTKKVIDDIRSENRSLKHSGKQKFLNQWLDDIESQIQSNGELKPIDIIDAKGTKISLNDDIHWNPEARGAEAQLRRLKSQGLDLDLKAYGQKGEEHQTWYKQFKEADDFYGKYLGDETGLASDTIKSILNHEDPERIILKLNKPSDFDVIEKFLSRTPEGKEFFNSIKREKLDSIFAKSFQSVQESKDKVSWSNLAKNLSDPSKAVLIKRLAGEDVYKKLQSFAKYAEGMSARFKRNPNASGSAQEGVILAVIGGAIGGGGGIVSAAKGIGKAAIFGSILSWSTRNRKMMNIALNAAKASSEGRTKDALKWGSMLDKSFTEEFGESSLKQIAQEMAKESRSNDKSD